MQRREFLKFSGFVPFAMFGCGNGSKNRGFFANEQSTLLAKSQPLPIPKLLEPEVKNGIKKFTLNILESNHEFFKNIKSKTYAIDSTYLGPTILVKNGEDIEIEYKNHLKETTTMHGHGMHVPSIMDGGVHQTIKPNESWSAKYRVNQKACTNWYHPHAMGKTAEQVYMGLAGLIIVEDKDSKTLNIPNEYGVDDIPLVLQDKNFSPDGQIDYSPSRMQIMRGYTADTLLINGAIEPFFNAKNGWLRLRLLNGSNARIFKIGFKNNLSFYQIATDNSFLQEPVLLNNLLLSPGERAEILVFVDKDLVLMDMNSSKNLLYIFKDSAIGLVDSLPSKLTTIEKMDPLQAKRVRRFELGMNMRTQKFTINSKSMNKERIDEILYLDEVEIWEITNSMMMNHNFHIHATHFEILELNGSSNIPKNLQGYKDTIYMPPNSSAKILVKMKDYADEKNPYMYHCHFLEHEDNGMMGQFIVKERA